MMSHEWEKEKTNKEEGKEERREKEEAEEGEADDDNDEDDDNAWGGKENKMGRARKKRPGMLL